MSAAFFFIHTVTYNCKSTHIMVCCMHLITHMHVHAFAELYTTWYNSVYMDCIARPVENCTDKSSILLGITMEDSYMYVLYIAKLHTCVHAQYVYIYHQACHVLTTCNVLLSTSNLCVFLCYDIYIPHSYTFVVNTKANIK